MDRPSQTVSGDKPQVFVCYSHRDANLVHPELAWLKKQGIRVWYDEDISPGQEWSEALGLAIDQAAWFLFFITPRSVASRHCRNEVHYAQSHEKPILAIHLEVTRLPPGLELALGSGQAILAYELAGSRYRKRLWEALAEGSIHGPLGTQAIGDELGPRTSRSRRMAPGLAALSGLLVIGLSYLLVSRAPLFDNEESAQIVPISETSIAVLPFSDLSAEKNQEYLADGMAEEIINLLANARGVRVSARTSSFYFKQKPAKIPDIARELNVFNVLEGSVRLVGDRLRVTAQLIRADTGYHVWSQSYDREFNDVFAVQDDIAMSVAEALQIHFDGGLLSRRTGGTQDLEAYRSYLQGLETNNQNSKQSLSAAAKHLQRAVELDPSYGLPWVELAWNAISMVDAGALSTSEGYESARTSAERALLLSPELASAHSALQFVHVTWDWDWLGAKQAGLKALDLDPTDVTALMIDASLSYALGEWRDAERKLQAALARDPLNAFAYWHLGRVYYGAGNFLAAELAFKRVLDLSPGYLWAGTYLGKSLQAQGKLTEAAAMITQLPQDEQLAMLPYVLWSDGRETDAAEALRALIRSPVAEQFPYIVALAYAYFGDRDATFHWLDRAYEQGDPTLVELLGEPFFFQRIADDPRFVDLTLKMNLPTPAWTI